MNTQFKKGALALCVLTILSRKDCYGYELVQTISKNIDVAEGTIYPLLRRLSAEGYFETYLLESTGGPPRKYYRLTQKGHSYRNELETEWTNFSAGVSRILTIPDDEKEKGEMKS
ncbi:MAG: PadR family transcriptional regulator [Acidobacteria bacterium]|nr:MAG: PadR family transcriptional regulator [Acidobacteriota bacterium]